MRFPAHTDKCRHCFSKFQCFTNEVLEWSLPDTGSWHFDTTIDVVIQDLDCLELDDDRKVIIGLNFGKDYTKIVVDNSYVH